ncbi:unnamed protein product [Adineta steineri]|uniref:Coiled-coil domain-containing protein 39 n=2 Tax=Adineta steineri TaxID=433720 RepID=A0A815B7V5_9BILA|nr:unnamed protein product [Adineta steineri]
MNMNLQHIPTWFKNINFFRDEYIDTRIPAALINDENKLLEENVEAKIKEITSKQLDIDENIDRIQLLENHHKIIQDELRTIQRLLMVRRTEETTEQSHIDIDLNEIQRLKRLTMSLDTELIRFTKRKINFEMEIQELNKEISTISNETLMEKDALEKLIESIKKHDDETFCFIKYTQEDNSRIKELTIQMERLSEKSNSLKRVLEEERIEYVGHEIELDKIANTFRRSHKQRQQLIQQWETILIQMQRKDYDIDKFSMELLQIKIISRTKEQELNEQKIFYEREQKNNIIMEKIIHSAKQKVQILKTKQKTTIEKQEYLETDVLSLKTVLFNTQNQLQNERASLGELKTNIHSKERQFTKLKQQHKDIINRKSFILNEKFTINEKLSKFDKLMENEEKYQKKLNGQYKKYSEVFFLLNNELLSLKKREKQYDLDNQTYRNQIHSIKYQINKFDQQLLKQQELIYHQDFLKQTIDHRLNRILNEKMNEKSSESDLKINELQNEYKKKKSQYDQLQSQIKLLHEEIRLIKRDFDQLIEEKNELNEKFLQFDLYTNLSDKMITKLNDEKEDYLVETNVLNVELKRLKNLLHNSSEINFNLKQHKIEIQKAIKERRMEVQANSQLFRLRLNDERTKKATISTELAMRITKITKLKYRYESFAITLNTDKSDEDNILEQAQYVIKSAQMKEDLLKQGDQLQALVIKAENELRALENTVQILKWNNMDVKRAFDKLNKSSSEICDMEKLEEHLRSITEQVKIRRKILKDFTEKNNLTSQSDLTYEVEQINLTNTNKCHIQNKLEKEIEQYHTKIVRADQLIKRYQQNFENIQQDIFDIDIRLQRETNKKIEQQLVSLCLTIGDNNLINTFEQLTADQGFKIIVKPLSSQLKFENKSSSSSSSNINFTPNIVNISIDSSSKSSNKST